MQNFMLITIIFLSNLGQVSTTKVAHIFKVFGAQILLMFA